MSPTLTATLDRINRQSEEQEAMLLATRLGIGYAKLDGYPFNLEALQMIPLSKAQEQLYAPYLRTSARIRFAVVHPENEDTIAQIKAFAQGAEAEAELIAVSESSFRFLIESYTHLLSEAEHNRKEAVQTAQLQAEKDYVHKIKSLDDLAHEVTHATVTEILDAIIAAAYNQNASDIHLEPAEEGLVVRFRIDGVLQRALLLPISTHHHIVSRIKVMAKIALTNETTSQDGRFSTVDKGINADFRVSIVPTGYGEGIVMRLLRQDMQSLTLEQLGFTAHNLALIEKSIKRPYGLILVTGPTGSGKSTTLYSVLSKLNSPEKKILTLEDPIEYRLAGIQQSQVDTERGYTFAEGLRGALRQDPDIVMVGEIRDPETATIALNASLTGHLVLSTLHTNDAVTAHTRFLELGVEPFLLSGSIQLIIAQRLVRELVPGGDPAKPEYKGRLVIAEVLAPSQDFEQAVLRHADQATLRSLAVAGGMIPMLEDGMEKVKAGLTSEQEVYRVTAA